MPYVTLFFSTLFLGTILSLSSSHWVFVWVGLELNLMSFIPLLTASKKFHASEAAMTYFLAQALGSGLLLLGSLSLLFSPHMPLPSNVFSALLCFGLLVKMGLPPCHFWFPSVMSMISWPMCITLSTWQKLTPILILLFTVLPNMNYIMILVIAASSFVGGVGGMNQTQLRPLLAYSSIGHMSWMLAGSLVSVSTSLLYLTIYIFMNMSLMIMFSASSSHSNISSLNMNSFSKMNNLKIFALVMSLGGLPPFLGFFPKWMILESVSPMFPLIMLITLLGSVISLYYYLNLIFINMVSSSKFPIILPVKLQTSILLPLSTTLTLGLGPSLFIFMYALTIFY